MTPPVICPHLFMEHPPTWFTLSSAAHVSLIKLKGSRVTCLSVSCTGRGEESSLPPELQPPAWSLEREVAQESLLPSRVLQGSPTLRLCLCSSGPPVGSAVWGLCPGQILRKPEGPLLPEGLRDWEPGCRLQALHPHVLLVGTHFLKRDSSNRGSSAFLLFKFFLHLFIFDRETQSISGGGPEKRRHRIGSRLQAPSLSAQSPTRGSNPQTVRS